MGTSRLKDIERRTGRHISFCFTKDEAAGKDLDQIQSPLYSILPTEIRDLIWAYTFAPYEDPNEYQYRPGYTARLKTDARLLRTCRRVFLEANQLPMLQSEHSFFSSPSMAPKARYKQWMSSLTSHNRENLGYLRFFPPMQEFQGGEATFSAEPGRLRRCFLDIPAKVGDFQPRIFHVILRYTDLCSSIDGARLVLGQSWIEDLLDTPDLRSTETLKIELEVPLHRLDQLPPLLERLRKIPSKEYETHWIDDRPVKTKFVLSPIEETDTWPGPTPEDYHVYGDYYMTTPELATVTPTWNILFPDMPRASGRELRRTGRIWIPPIPESQAFIRAKTISNWEDYRDGVAARNLARRSGQGGIDTQQLDRKHIKDDKGPSEGEKNSTLMRDAHKALLFESKKQADKFEDTRWWSFGRAMDLLLPEMWQETRSLLKFVDE